MLSVTKLLALSTLLISIAACDSGSSSNDRIKGGNKEPGNCIPESQLTGIIGGNRVNPGDFDAKLVMMLNVPQGEDLGICTAAAIAPDVLLTAGHCVHGDLNQAFVTLHTSISCESGFDARYNVTKVLDFIVHEKFELSVSESDPAKMVGDIALVFLKNSLPSQYPIYKIARPKDLVAVDEISFYGYGSIGQDKKGAAILRSTHLSFDKIKVDVEQKKVFVDQSNGRGICTGDSGGPGLVRINGEYQILGINSYVDGRSGDRSDYCKGESALVLADSYRDWIEAKLKSRGRRLRQ